MRITENLMRRFVKDTGIPISIFNRVVFMSRINLFQRSHEARMKYDEFLAELEMYADEKAFFDEQDRVISAAIKFLNANPAMTRFAQSEDMNKFQCKNIGYKNSSVFKDINVGKYLLSIDMIKANFTALRHYDKAIFDGAEKYEDFIGKFTNSEYTKNSKHIRQVIFGNINPKRQQTYEKYLMDKILTEVLSIKGITKEHIEYFGADEIVVDVSDFVTSDDILNDDLRLKIEKVVERACADGIRVRAECYQLYKIDGTSGYMKRYLEYFGIQNIVSFKCLNPIEYPFVVRAYLGEEPEYYDHRFIYEGREARLCFEIPVKFVNKIEQQDEKR